MNEMLCCNRSNRGNRSKLVSVAVVKIYVVLDSLAFEAVEYSRITILWS